MIAVCCMPNEYWMPKKPRFIRRIWGIVISGLCRMRVDDLLAEGVVRKQILKARNGKTISLYSSHPLEEFGPYELAWAMYRQALRDITTQADFPACVPWPTEPNA